MHHPTDRITHITAFVIPVVEHWLEQEIAQPLEQDCTHYNLLHTLVVTGCNPEEFILHILKPFVL